MPIDDFFEYEINELSEKLEITSKMRLNGVKFKEISIPSLNLKFAIPITDDNLFFYYNWNNQKDISFTQDKNEIIFEKNDTLYQIIFKDKKIDSIFFSKSYQIHPGYSMIGITLKSDGLIIPSGKISFDKNCIQLFLSLNSKGEIDSIKSDYNEFAAAYSANFEETNVENLYEGILVEHYKEKEGIKFGEIGEIRGYSQINLDKEKSLFVLANETGFKKNFKLNYEKTILNLINSTGSKWEHLVVYDELKQNE